jgi:hypothetical protein
MNMENILCVTPDDDLEKFVKFFSLSSNISLKLGGKLKRMEYLSGRYADILSDILYASALIWDYEKNKGSYDKEVIEIARREVLAILESRSCELIANHPDKWIH